MRVSTLDQLADVSGKSGISLDKYRNIGIMAHIDAGLESSPEKAHKHEEMTPKLDLSEIPPVLLGIP